MDKRQLVAIAFTCFVAAFSGFSAADAQAQNMGAPDFDADLYNVTAQFLSVAKKGDAVRARALPPPSPQTDP